MSRTEAFFVCILSVVVTLALLFASEVQSWFVRPVGMAAPAVSGAALAPSEAVQGAVPALPSAAARATRTPAAGAVLTPAQTAPVTTPSVPDRPTGTGTAPETVTVPAPPPATAPAPAPTAASAPPLARGRQLTALLYSGRLDRVWAAFLPSVRAEWGNFSAFRAYRAGGLKTYGAEKTLLKEKVVQDGGVTYYTRTATFEREPGTGWTLIFGLDARGNVQEFGIVGAGLLPGD